VRIQVKQGATVLHEHLFANGDWSTADWNLAAAVTAGSTLDFVITRVGQNIGDAAYFNPAILFTAAGPAPPAISNVQVSRQQATSVLITWASTVAGTTEVEYGLTEAYGQTAWKDPRQTTSHSVHLSGLLPNTPYYFRVKTVDGAAVTHTSLGDMFTTPAVPVGSTLFAASADYATTQGENQWTYRDSNGPMATVLTSGQVVNDFGPTWQGGEPYTLLWATGGHPGSAGDVIRRWTAPADGMVQITGVAHIYGAGITDGVRVQVKQGDAVLHERLFANGDWSTADWDLSLAVTGGTTLDFVINRVGHNIGDATAFDPAILFTPTGFTAAGPGPATSPVLERQQVTALWASPR
jgi:hypothetical protein